MVACKTETEPVVEKEDVIALSDLQINLGSNLKVESTISAQTIRQGISANLSINDGEKQRKNLEELFNEFKDKKAVTITVTNNDETVYSITNKGLPTNGYTFTKEENNFKVSVNIGNASFSFSKAFSVAPKEQGGSEEGQGSTPTVTEDPAPETPEYIVSVSYSTALESYQEEDDTDLLKELRIAVVFDGDEYSSHTKTFNLEELYGWLSDTDRYFEFKLYADDDRTEEPLYSFSKGRFRETSGILLNAEGAYSYRCTLRIMIYWGEEFSGDFSVNILPETGTPITIRSAALLWNINANALPSPPQEVTLTASLIKALGDATSGKLARYKTEERLASNLDAARAHYGIDITDATTAASALAACIGRSIVVEKNGTRDIGNEYGYINIDADISKYILYANDLGLLGEAFPSVIEVESYKISKGNIVLDGTLNYNEIDIVNAGASISADDAVFSMKQTYEEDNICFVISPKAIFDMYARLFDYDPETFLKEVITQPAKLRETPKLNYYIHGQTRNIYHPNGLTDNDIVTNIIALHKLYDGNEEKLNLDESIDTLSFIYYAGGEKVPHMFEFQGADFFKDGKTMFEGNKINTDNDIPNISADILRKLATKYNIKYIKNLVVTGNYSEAKDEYVDIYSELTNVVFEGDVSGLKNSENDQFNGIVYFMDKPYNNIQEHSFLSSYINGIVKLDKLEGVSYDTFRVNCGVLDLRGRDDLGYNPLKGYNIETKSEKAINYAGHEVIYFTKEYVDNIEGIDTNSSIKEKFETLTRRVQQVGGGGSGVHNVYVDNDKYDSIADKISTLDPEHHAVSATPRSLEEFEYYGNNGKFKTPAYDSYNDDFDGVHPDIIEKLKKDKDSGAYNIP